MNTFTRVTTPTDREIHVERNFLAPRELVWRAFTEPQLIAQWWGRGHRLDIERMDVERGGHWRFVEHTSNGLEGFEGRYREVVPGIRIVRSFEYDGTPGHVIIETTTFEDRGYGAHTAVSSTSVFHTAAERDSMLSAGIEEGLTESYAALDRLLASMHSEATVQP